MKPNDFHAHLTAFLTKYLLSERGVSGNTLSSYKDTFLLLIRFFEQQNKVPVNKLGTAHITKQNIVAFLNWLQNSRGCSAQTRNNRLAAIRSFCKYLQYEELDTLYQCQQILSIRVKKAEQKSVSYLTLNGMKLLLEQPITSTKNGRRDFMILMYMYETASRVQEVIDITPAGIHFSSPSTVAIKGKGNKTRRVPISKRLAGYLRSYMEEHALLDQGKNCTPLFYNKYGGKLTRNGVAYILEKYAKMAREQDAVSIPQGLHCHCLRHSRAMHLLQEGLPLVYIRDFMGHVSITTTEIYARIDSKQKQEALEKISKIEVQPDKRSWQKDHALMALLKSL